MPHDRFRLMRIPLVRLIVSYRLASGIVSDTCTSNEAQVFASLRVKERAYLKMQTPRKPRLPGCIFRNVTVQIIAVVSSYRSAFGSGS